VVASGGEPKALYFAGRLQRGTEIGEGQLELSPGRSPSKCLEDKKIGSAAGQKLQSGVGEKIRKEEKMVKGKETKNVAFKSQEKKKRRRVWGKEIEEKEGSLDRERGIGEVWEDIETGSSTTLAFQTKGYSFRKDMRGTKVTRSELGN